MLARVSGLGRALPAALLCLLVVACAGTGRSGAVGASRFQGFVLVRDYVDRFSIDGEDQLRRVQYGWNYDQRQAEQRIFDLDDTLLERIAEPGLTLELSKPELARALALVHAHPQLRDVAAQADLELQGGFSLREPGSICDVGSRCVHIIGAGPEGGARLHAIVDLDRDAVVVPQYHGVLAANPAVSEN